SVRKFFFEGKAGKSYSFLSVAEDNAGNREKAPTLADAVTTIFAPPPTLSIISKSETIVGQPLSFGFAVTNFDAIPNLGYLIKVDWDNDGNFDNTVLGPEGTTISHAFDSAGSKNVRAALFNSDDVIVAETNTVIEVALAGVVTDPENESSADLVWGGTEGNDRYRFEELNSTTIRVITLNADDEVIDSVDFTGVTGSVRAYTLAGNDFVDASALITKSLYADLGDGDDTVLGGKADDFIDADGAEGHGNDEIISGDGNDTISADGSEGYDPDDSTGQDTILAGSGNDVIDADGAEGSNDDVIEGGSGDDVIHADGAEGIAEGGTYGKDTVSGGEGDDLIVGDGAEGAVDQITGDDGNDVIIGGAGADQLDGGIGSDLVVAGTVTDLDAASLILVHAEWKSTRSLAQRVDNLLGTGTGDRANDDVFLTPANTKLVDQAIDSVLGGADEDWLLADAGEDEITDYEPLEDILSF
ncbi:hypothetical protein K2Y11_23885, partial [bacterium]|nr:hypothetical protein [bacterium]